MLCGTANGHILKNVRAKINKMILLPKQLLPTRSSSSQQWAIYYTSLKNRYDKTSADAAMAYTWQERGNPSLSAEVEHSTGFELDKSALESLQSTGLSAIDTGGSLFSGIVGSTKTIMVVAVVAVSVLAVGFVYRAITASSEEIGNIGGAALKAYTGKVA